MNLLPPSQIVPIHRKESLLENGMLFVRTDSIFETMVNVPLIAAAGLIAIVLAMPVQSSFSSTRVLDLTLYSDGSAHITTQLDVDPLEPDFQARLLGPSVDNFVAVGENGFLLSSEITGDDVTIHTFGSPSITIDYDVHDLISKEGRIWTFSLDSENDYSLLMPLNSIIVGMSAFPSSMELVNDQTRLDLGAGLSEINYIFANTNPPVVPTPPDTTTPVVDPVQPPSFTDVFISSLGGILVVTVVGIAVFGVIVIIKRRQARPPAIPHTETGSISLAGYPDTETIFNLRPQMREDDKEIIKFIFGNGGKALESELRKKFLQPRTTMWRAVKRLERQGIIEITKKDLQNLVKLRKDLEKEEQ